MARLSPPGATVLAGLAVAFSAAVITLVIGPRYLQPLPTLAKLIVAVAGCCFIGAVALYSRRRAGRV